MNPKLFKICSPAKIEGVPKLAVNLETGKLEMTFSLCLVATPEQFQLLSLSRKDGCEVEITPVRQPLPLKPEATQVLLKPALFPSLGEAEVPSICELEARHDARLEGAEP